MKSSEEEKKQVEALKKERDILSQQTSDLWELLSMNYDCNPSIIEALIELRGLEHVTEVFKDDYATFKKEKEDEE